MNNNKGYEPLNLIFESFIKRFSRWHLLILTYVAVSLNKYAFQKYLGIGYMLCYIVTLIIN